MEKDIKKILLIMVHSAGVGDMLRASASWRALKNKFPTADLHLLFLTKDPGYVSETLISKHHILASFHTLDKRLKSLKDWIEFFKGFDKLVKGLNPDLIVDMEPHGLESSMLCLYARLKYKIPSVGIAEFPGRGLFYTHKAPSSRAVLKSKDYTDRYFVVLKAFGIERKGLPIELEETQEGRQFRETMRSRFSIPEDVPLLGLNIGCGTPDALWKRPNLELLREAVHKVQQATSSFLVLSGADFEADVNERFLEGYHLPALNLAGKTNILELTGLIKACRLFISSDSGPYHMGVALKVPTLGVFVKDFPYSYHNHPWVRNVVLQSHQDIEKFISSALELWKYPSG